MLDVLCRLGTSICTLVGRATASWAFVILSFSTRLHTRTAISLVLWRLNAVDVLLLPSSRIPARLFVRNRQKERPDDVDEDQAYYKRVWNYARSKVPLQLPLLLSHVLSHDPVTQRVTLPSSATCTIPLQFIQKTIIISLYRNSSRLLIITSLELLSVIISTRKVGLTCDL